MLAASDDVGDVFSSIDDTNRLKEPARRFCYTAMSGRCNTIGGKDLADFSPLCVPEGRLNCSIVGPLQTEVLQRSAQYCHHGLRTETERLVATAFYYTTTLSLCARDVGILKARTRISIGSEIMPTLCRMDRRGMEPRPVRASGGRESHRLTTGATMASLPAILICLVGLAPSVLSQEGGDDVATSGPSSRPTAMQSPSRMPAPTTTTVATTPTVVPAAVKPVIIRARYEQDLIVEIDSNLLDDNETATFEGIMSKYTKDYGLEPELDKPYVNTTCNINTQTILNTVAKSTPKPTIPPQLSPVPSESPTSNILMEDLKAQLTIKPTTAPQSPTTAPQPPSFRPTESTGKGGRFLRPVEKVRYKIIHVPYQRVLQSKKLRIKYSLTWESSHPLNNIGGYPNKFVKFINDHLTRVTDDLRKAGLTQIKSAESVLIQETTPKPTPLPTSTKPTEDPTHVPTPSPTFSMQPTHAPTLHPTQYPSQSPSYIPSTEPTSENESKVETTYEQDFKLSEMINRFDDDRIGFFGSVMEGYTNYYGAKLHPQPLRVTTVCEIMDNKLFTTPKLRLTYKMTWSSNHSKVDEYNDAFIEFINGNLTRVTEDLNRAGLAVVSVSEEVLLQKVTPKPTKEPTSAPTKFPTPLPTRPPSNPPTFSTTFAPTEASTTDKPAPPPLASTPSTPPTSTPTLSTPTVSTLSPSTPPPSTPSASPTVNRDPGFVLGNVAIGAMASGIAAVLVLFVYWVYRRRSRQKDSAFTRNHREGNKRGRDFPNSIGGSNGIPAGSRHERLGGMRQAQAVDDRVDVDIAMDTSAEGISVGDYNYAIGLEPRRSNDLHDVDQIPADESLVSNQSLISRGLSMSSDSAHEDDARDHLADEFDQYKDQNLEKMRAEVEGTVTNVDGMMSRALTKALMDDVEEKDPKELTWGGSRNAIEIEASVLCEMNDWLKRKEGASLDERLVFDLSACLLFPVGSLDTLVTALSNIRLLIWYLYFYCWTIAGEGLCRKH